jgi:hypothetical protein
MPERQQQWQQLQRKERGGSERDGLHRPIMHRKSVTEYKKINRARSLLLNGYCQVARSENMREILGAVPVRRLLLLCLRTM